MCPGTHSHLLASLVLFWGSAWQLPALLLHDQSNLLGRIQIEAAGNLPSAEELLFPKKSDSCKKKKKSPLYLLPGGVARVPTVNAEKLIKRGGLLASGAMRLTPSCCGSE